MEKTASVPTVIDPLLLSRGIADAYDNRSLTTVNDHEVRMSVMTGPYVWHLHPDSDETFLIVEGELLMEFENTSVVLRPGQFLTVPKGVLHRTRPGGERSVNLTFERNGASTIFQ